MEFFKKMAVSPDDLPDAIFASVGRLVWRDIGPTALGFRLLLKARGAGGGGGEGRAPPGWGALAPGSHWGTGDPRRVSSVDSLCTGTRRSLSCAARRWRCHAPLPCQAGAGPVITPDGDARPPLSMPQVLDYNLFAMLTTTFGHLMPDFKRNLKPRAKKAQ